MQIDKEENNTFESQVNATERTFFIERTGVVMRWILLFTCSIIQLVKPVIPNNYFYIILPISILYNFLLNLLIYNKRVHIIIISYFSATIDIIVSVLLIFLSAKTDIYLWYFVLLVSHAARFGFIGSIVSPVIFSAIYIIGLRVQGLDLPAHTLFIRSTFFIITGIVSGYLAREEHKRFNNILKQQHDILISHQKRKELREVFQRYVSYNVVEELLSAPDSMMLVGVRKKVSILFSDIEGFTRLLSQREPEAVIKLLNEYFTEMTNIIFHYEGMVDKFVGDAIIGIFGAIKTSPGDSYNAVRCAFEMQNRLKQLRAIWEKDSEASINSRIAVNTGEVIMGNVGSPKRMDYTAIGDPVNTASRMQSIAENNSVVISKSTYEECRQCFETIHMGKIQLKGKPHPIDIYKVVSIKGTPTAGGNL